MRLFIAGIALLVAACSPEQSTGIGAQPKKTMDSVSSRVNQAMQQSGQGSERLKEGDEAN
jgi:hypothetical protein